MTAARIIDLFRAVLRRDVLSALRYKRAAMLLVATIPAELAALYYLARAIGPGFRPDGVSFYSFLLVGSGMYALMITAVTVLVRNIEEAQQTGTFEILMTTNTDPVLLIILSATSTCLSRVLYFCFYVVAGLLLFQVNLPAPNITAILLIFGLSLLVVVAIGLFAAAVQVHTQRGGAVLWLLGSLLWLLTGVAFPVSVLPAWLRAVAALIPLKYSLHALRLALLQGASFSNVRHDALILAAFAVVLFPAGTWTLNLVLRKARLQGTLSFY